MTVPERPRLEDVARKSAPVPACIVPLPPRRTVHSAPRQLREDQYWSLVFPGFDAAKSILSKDATDCTGYPVLRDATFAGGTPLHGTELHIEEGDIQFTGGGDRLKVIWMQTHHFADGTLAGPLALVRTLDAYAEVYAITSYRGSPDKTKTSLERMGPEVLVTMQNDGCAGKRDGNPCETLVHVYLPRGGRLLEIVQIPLERVGYATNGEPGGTGRVEYRLTTSPVYEASGIRVAEQVVAHDDVGHELRKAEVERLYRLNESKLVSDQDPLWPRLFVPPL